MLPEERTPPPALDEEALASAIAARVPGADEARVRSLLSAWWRYAGIRAAAGAVVDSDRFIAERSALGLLELQPGAARAVIELEFALLHDPVARDRALAGVELPAEAPAAPPPPAQVPEPVSVREPEPEPEPDPEPAPARLPTPVAAVAPVVAAPAPNREPELDDEPVPVAVLAAMHGIEIEPSRTPQELQTMVMAALVVVASLAIGLAIVAARYVPDLGGAGALVTPWRAWLAVLVGAAGALAALVAAARSRRVRRAVLAPGTGLAGIATLGVGLLAGTAAVAVGGGAVAAAGALGAIVVGQRGR